MENPELPDRALDVMLSEYGNLRDEIKERLKIAFSHVAYAGAIAAFALPAAEKAEASILKPISLVVAGMGDTFLCWVAFLNIRWVQHCGAYIETIGHRINLHFGAKVLGWESHAADVQGRRWFFIPKKPHRNVKAPIE